MDKKKDPLPEQTYEIVVSALEGVSQRHSRASETSIVSSMLAEEGMCFEHEQQADREIS